MEKNNFNGFTLIELIVVMAIVGLLAGMVIPRFFNTLTNVELKSAARKTVSFLNQARDLSYYKKKYTKVSFYLATGHTTLSEYRNATTEEKKPFASPEMIWVEIKDFFLPDGVRLHKFAKGNKTITKNRFDIIFYPAGNTDGGRITLVNNKGRQFVINVDPITGNARITEAKNENE